MNRKDNVSVVVDFTGMVNAQIARTSHGNPATNEIELLIAGMVFWARHLSLLDVPCSLSWEAIASYFIILAELYGYRTYLLPLLSKTLFCNLNLDFCKTRVSYLFLCCKLYYACRIVLLGITTRDVTRRVSWWSGSSPSRRWFCHKLQFEKLGSIVQNLKTGSSGQLQLKIGSVMQLS
jgi:hypothetical protein